MQFIADFMQRWWVARDERRHQFNIHQVRRTWTLSGVRVGSKNALSDAGVTDMRDVTLDEARTKLAAWYPRATVVHVDEVNFVITYQIS